MINKNSVLAQEYFAHGRLRHVPILDFHAHIGPLKGGYLPAAKPSDMVKAMDCAGVRLLLSASHRSLAIPGIGEEEDILAAKTYPGRIFAYHCVLSRQEDSDSIIKRIETHRDVYVGLKFHSDTHRVALDDACHAPVLEYANANHMLVLCHTWGNSPYDGVRNLAVTAERYPNIAFICGHSFHGCWNEGIAMASEHNNIYLELTAVEDNRGVMEKICEKMGSRRILFGVDLPWFSYHYGIGAVLSADITDEDRLNIFYRNGAILLAR